MQNALVFVSDALRWDTLPNRIRSKGTVLKSVSESTLTPTSFSSLCSGLHAPDRGIRSFSKSLPPNRNVLLEEAPNGVFWERPDDDPIYAVLGQNEDTKSLESVSPPFVFVERELATHSPYNSREDTSQRDAGTFFSDFANELGDLRETYREGAEQTARVFESRLQTLFERGLLNDTLVIFTSDHGELLGEYGQLSHTMPLVPELAYVPTVLVHPDGKQPQGMNIMSTVDILPTVFGELGIELPYETDGVNAYNDEPRKSAYSSVHLPRGRSPMGDNDTAKFRDDYHAVGLFDQDGGVVYNDSPLRDRLWTARYHSHPAIQIGKSRLSTTVDLFARYVRNKTWYGNPNFSDESARDRINQVQSTSTRRTGSTDLSEEQIQRLEQLGYK